MTVRCETCDRGARQPARRPYVQQRGHRVAVVTDVPVEECAACREVGLAEDVALRLDELLTEMLTTELVAVPAVLGAHVDCCLIAITSASGQPPFAAWHVDG